MVMMPFPEYYRQSNTLVTSDLSLLDAFHLLFAAVLEASKTDSICSIFRGLESTLRNLEPMVKDRGSLSLPKEKTRELVELMRKGEALVGKCLMRSHRICWNKHHYAKKLRKLEDDILRLVRVYVPLRICLDSKELLLEVKDLGLEVRKLNDFMEEEVRGNVKRSEGFESCEVPKEPNFMVGLDDSFRQLKGQLLKGGVSRLVLSAPKGFGKTTLVKKLGHDADIEGKFKNIFFINASKSPDFMVMVHKMIQSHHKGVEVPDIETEADAVYQLQLLLTQMGDGPVLLILDDVPSHSKSLLEKFVFNKLPDYKILVTSRFEFPSFGPAHQLSRLNHEDAQKLFLHSAVPQFGSPQAPNEDLTEKMVELCDGSPLALTEVGKSLCGKHPSIWRSVLLELSEDPSLMDSGSNILDHLGRSKLG
ncbi:probable disease resistance protein At5g66900 [Punica granatum]|uniref:Uncharacterized protein n=2 Tax=Punica granatum TaxID=22663 RepID=A0A2I0LDZ0_PUNGR|nr:probable disease resistance protein At5g66900 [Punica granatum]PKI78436.1 hypothetical protein CRG98_001182 [Punica granatum]